MVEIFRKSYGDNVFVFGYKITETENGEVIDFINNTFSNVNKWNKENLLTGSVVYRRRLSDILEYLGFDREDFERNIKTSYEEGLTIEDSIDNTEGNLFQILMPTRYTSKNGKSEKVSGWYDDSKNEVNVFVDRDDYSFLFEDFDVFEEKAVNKAYELLVSGDFIKVDNNLKHLEKDVEGVLSRVLENGFFFSDESFFK